MSDDWSGRSAVVTGGARGQGRSVALKLLAAGAEVFVMDRLPTGDQAWAQLADQAGGLSGKLVALEMDVASEAAWADVADRIRSGSRPCGALVNNAGITGPRNTVTRSVPEEWNRVLQVNINGAFLGIRAIAPLMPRGGSIVNISSTVGMMGYYSAAYSTSKWALRGLTKSASMELAPKGIRVNTVCPGAVDTEMIQNSPALMEALRTIIPMQAMATPDQIADAVIFLLSPQAGYITGADLPVDGGVTAGGTYWPVARQIGVL